MAFDVQAFLDQTVEGTNDTKKVPCPAGDFTGIVDKVAARSWQAKDDPTKSGMTLDVSWIIEDESAKSVTGRDKVVVRQGIMLDLTDEGKLDMGKGKNIGLGRLREALGLNNGGPFSFAMMVGRMAKVSVSHRMGETSDDIYDEIKKVAPL